MSSLRAPVALAILLALAPALSAQAERLTSKLEVGAARLEIEYGSPPWNESRTAQVERLPVGRVWRLGADQRTTFVVEGGACLIGDVVIESGGYGLNVRRTGEKEWAFVVFEGSDTEVALEDAAWEIPAQFDGASEKQAGQLSVAFEPAAGGSQLAVRFGPLTIRAPVAAVEVEELEIELGGESVSARWFTRDLKSAAASRAFVRAGSLDSFWVGDVDCGMDVELAVAGGGQPASVRFVLRERARLEARLALRDAEIARNEAAAQGGNRRAAAMLEPQREARAADAEALAAFEGAPPVLVLDVPLDPKSKGSGRVGARLVRKGDALFVRVDAGDRSGEAAVDEGRLLPSSSR